MSHEDFDRWEEERRRRQKEREQRRAERRRERSPRDEEPGREERKERVLHTRISESLDDAIRRAADELRVPVSNLVRNVLEDAFSVVEKVTDNMGDIVEDVLGEVDDVRRRIQRDIKRHRKGRERRSAEGRFAREFEQELEREVSEPPAVEREREEYPDVVGWQPLILNAEQQCVDCGRDLGRGDRGFVGLTAAGISGRYLCGECARARS
jgi:hypothetical protein